MRIREKEVFEELKRLARDFYETFYDMKKEKINGFHKNRNNAKKEIQKISDSRLREKMMIFAKQSDIMMSVLHARMMQASQKNPSGA